MVRPVELQDALGKTQAVERIAQLQKANSENEQRQVIQTEGQKHDDAQRKAVPTAHSDEVVLHRDRDNPKDKGKKKKDHTVTPAQNAAADDNDQDPLPPPELDITV